MPMRNVKLPRGLKYSVDKVQLGTIDPGSDKEPIVTIVVREGTIQYRLISYILKKTDTPTWEGNIAQPVLDEVDAWVFNNLPMLLAEAHLHRIIRFDKKSKCYYDFQTQTLYEANGVYEKKGSTANGLKNVAAINGEPILLPDSVIPFIEILTKKPRVPFGIEIFIGDVDDFEIEEKKKKALSQAFYKFLRYDSSIKDTFIRETTGLKLFQYIGEPQVWFVGEGVQNEILTVKKIFDVVAQYEVLSICAPETGIMVDSVAAEDITLEESIAFMGLDASLIDTRLIDIKRFFESNYFSSVEVLKALLSQFCTMIDAVWVRIANNIKNNFLHSLSASTYFKDTKEIPHNQSDYFKAYPLNEDRLGIVLTQIYPCITNLIKEFGFKDTFFKNCDLEMTSEDGNFDIEKAIDGIVSLLLLGLWCYQTPYVDEELDCLRKRYHDVLLKLIQKKFGFIQPSDSGNGLIALEALQIELQGLIELQDLWELRKELLNEGQYARALIIEKVFDCLNLGFNDENSLLPPSTGRKL